MNQPDWRYVAHIAMNALYTEIHRMSDNDPCFEWSPEALRALELFKETIALHKATENELIGTTNG